jgi:hypothetical protein
MRVLLDECVPRTLRNALPGHHVQTVADLLLTVDRNLEYQQSFAELALAVIVVHAPSNDVAALRPLMPTVLAVMPQAKPGTVTHING